MFFGELVEVFGYYLLHERLELVIGPAVDLQQQALLQRLSAYAGRVELLQFGQHLAHLPGRDINVMVDGELVADGVETFAQNAIVVERAYQVLHHVMLLWR